MTPDQTLAAVREAKPIKESFTNPAPAMYCCLYGAFKEKAIELGYALAVHGSLARDFDLIAVPWTENAADAETLVESLREICGGFIIADGTGGGRYDAEAKQFVSAKVKNPEHKPHGRLAWSIQLGGRPQIDLSVMPRVALHLPEPGKLPMVGGRQASGFESVCLVCGGPSHAIDTCTTCSQPATDSPPPAERIARAIDFCRANLHPGVNIGRQSMAGEVLRILEGR